MNLFKKFTLTLVGLAFFVGMYVASAEAQRYSRWGNSGGYYGDTRYRSSNRNRRWSRGDRYRYASWRQRQRIARQRYALYNARNRYYRDGYLSWSERRRLAKRYAKYRRSAYRNYRNW